MQSKRYSQLSNAEKERDSSPSESSDSPLPTPEWLKDLTRRQLEQIDRDEASMARAVRKSADEYEAQLEGDKAKKDSQA
jgi:hypothetical protein